MTAKLAFETVLGAVGIFLGISLAVPAFMFGVVSFIQWDTGSDCWAWWRFLHTFFAFIGVLLAITFVQGQTRPIGGFVEHPEHTCEFVNVPKSDESPVEPFRFTLHHPADDDRWNSCLDAEVRLVDKALERLDQIDIQMRATGQASDAAISDIRVVLDAVRLRLVGAQ